MRDLLEENRAQAHDADSSLSFFLYYFYSSRTSAPASRYNVRIIKRFRDALKRSTNLTEVLLRNDIDLNLPLIDLARGRLVCHVLRR